MTGRKFEEVLDDLRGEVEEDLLKELEGFTGSKLRERAEGKEALEKENTDLKGRLDAIEAAPKRTEAFKDFGIDLENLSKAEQKALEAFDGDIADKDKLADFVKEYDLPFAEEGKSEGEGDGEGTSAVEAIVEHGRAAERRGPAGAKGVKVTLAQASEWPADKWMQFEEKYPEAAEKILQGQEVAGIAF